MGSSRAEWLRLLREAGFRPEIIHDQYGRDVSIVRRAARGTMQSQRTAAPDAGDRG